MRAMTLRLPDDVHDALRREAFESRRSMNAVVLEALATMQWLNEIIDRETYAMVTRKPLREEGSK